MKKFIIAGVVAIGLVLTGGVVGYTTANSNFDPDSIVAKYKEDFKKYVEDKRVAAKQEYINKQKEKLEKAAQESYNAAVQSWENKDIEDIIAATDKSIIDDEYKTAETSVETQLNDYFSNFK